MDTHSLPVHRLNRRVVLVAALLIFIGAALRVEMLSHDVRLHPDESLYATFARRMSSEGDFLLSYAPLDKPPLSLIVTALSFSIFGATEFAARLPTVFVSILILAVVYAVARRLYAGWRVPLLALLLLALSPLDLAFAATAFLDPLHTLFILLACLCALRDRWLWAGVAFILAVATKQSALVFLPLIVMMGMFRLARSDWTRRNVLIRLLRLTVPIIIGAVALALWSAARAAPVDFWTLGTINNNPGRLIRANEVVPRLSRWLDLLSNVLGFAPLLLLAIVPVIFAARRRTTMVSVALLAFIAAGLLGYWLVAFNTYDRYLHPFGPLIIVLAAAGAVRLHRWLPMIVVVCVIPFTANALRGDLSIGGDRGEHNGVVELATALNELPPFTRVSHYWLDWELAFYLGDSSLVQLIYQPSPESLMTEACLGNGYYITEAAQASTWLTPLVYRGIHPQLLMDGNLRLYWLDCTF